MMKKVFLAMAFSIAATTAQANCAVNLEAVLTLRNEQIRQVMDDEDPVAAMETLISYSIGISSDEDDVIGKTTTILDLHPNTTSAEAEDLAARIERLCQDLISIKRIE